MRKEKQIYSVYLIIAILFGLFYAPVSVEASQKYNSGGELLKKMSIDCANEYESCVENIAQAEAIMKHNHLTNVISMSPEYCKYYGGAYIDNEDNLVVLLTNDDKDIISYCASIIGNENIVYERCNISLKELNDLKECIVDFKSNTLNVENEVLQELKNSIVSVGIYEDGNKVFVQMTDCTRGKIDLFKRLVIDSEYVVFEESDDYENNSGVTLKNGDCILIRNNGEYYAYSIGFRCRKLLSTGSYIYGFITAGHGCANNDKVYDQYCEEIGYVYSSCYYNGASIDAAFVCLTNNNYSCSNAIINNKGSIATATCVSSYATGAMVYKAGWVSGVTTGKIVSASVDTFDEEYGITTSDCVKTTYSSNDGDSGGLVYMIITSNAKVIAGIHRGSTENYSYFVKQQNIRNILKVDLY